MKEFMTNPIRENRSLTTHCAKSTIDQPATGAPLSEPMIQSTIFRHSRSEELGERFDRRSSNVYQRFGHPTTAAAAKKIATLEGAESAQVLASGMAAITTSLLANLTAGDHLVIQRETFAQTFTFVEEVLSCLGIERSFVDATDIDSVREAIRNNTKVIYIDTPSNPLLRISDIKELAALAHESRALLFVDSTFASPYLQNPLELGADLVIHSASKFLGGHHDLLCGAVAGNAALVRRISEMQILLGGTMDPRAASLLLRSIKTLAVRMDRQCESALALAEYLATQNDVVRRVRYPWLRESEGYAIARRQMRGGGGVVSFEFEDMAQARVFVNSLKLIAIATSLGGVESVVEIPLELDFSDRHLGQAANHTGISSGLVRLSIGLEDTQELRFDLEQALECVRKMKKVAATR